MKKFKTLALSSVAFLCLCACSENPQEAQSNTAQAEQTKAQAKVERLNIQTIIPQDAEIALYAKSNEALIQELKAKPEYKSIVNALKTNFNQDLCNVFNQFLIEAEPTEAEKNAITAFINPNDVIGSIEYLLSGQDISISVYCKNAENIKINKLAEIVVAIKSGNPEFPEKVLALLDTAQEAQELAIKKSKVEGYDCFSFKIDNKDKFYILKVKDTFLFTAGEVALENLMAAIGNPSKSILDSKRFNDTIEDADSDLWVYINEQIFALASVAAKEEIPLKSIGMEMKLLSLESSTFKAKANLSENEFSPIIAKAFPNTKTTSTVKNVYDDTKFYASIQLPKSLEAVALIESCIPFANGMAPILTQLDSVDVAIPAQDINMLANEEFKATINVYLESISNILKMFPVPLQNINGFECLDTPKALIAKVNDKQVSVILDKSNVKADLNMLSAGKNNAKIENILNEISLENCIAEVYIDNKYFTDLLKEIASLSENASELEELFLLNVYERFDFAAKLGLSKDSISLAMKSNHKIDWKKYEELLLNFIVEIKKNL